MSGGCQAVVSAGCSGVAAAGAPAAAHSDSGPTRKPAALIWFRNDLRLADHEPLHSAAADLQHCLSQGQSPLLLPFYCLDERELAPRAGELPQEGGLDIPQLGPHRLRLLLEACASLRAALRRLGSDLLAAQGRPEALVGRLVALAAAAGSSSMALHHHMSPDAASADLEDAVAAAFEAAAARHGLPCSVHRYWGCTLYHPDDLPFHLWACGSASSGGRPGAAAVAGPAAEQQQQQRGQCSRVNREQQRFACLPAVMTDFRKAVQAHARVRPPLPAPRLASNSGGGGDGSAPTLPPLPAATAAAAAEAGLLGPLPTDLASVYSAAGGAATAALACWEALGAVRCAALAPACSGRHDARSALPFGMGEEQAVQRLRYYLGLEESDGHSVRSVDQEAPIATYRETRMQPFGVDSSAKLSAFLSLGCLSPRTAHAEVARLAVLEQQQQQQQRRRRGQASSGDAAATAAVAAAAGEAAAAWREPQAGDTWRWLLMHLAIRDFFVFTAVKEGDALEAPGGIRGRAVEWRRDDELFRRWAQGQTGLPFVDACMRELGATGFMSNRGRQNVASLLAKELCLDWRLGLRYFESCLADHEWALNAGNWAYCAGTGSDPRDRRFKTVSQGERYDPEARLIQAWVPQLAALRPAQLAHQPWAAPPAALAAAGVRLGCEPQAATAEAGTERQEQQKQQQLGGWYPLPVVDPASQIGKGPKQKQAARPREQRQQQPQPQK